MYSLLSNAGVLFGLAFFVTLIWLIVKALRKKSGKKLMALTCGSSFVLFIGFFVLALQTSEGQRIVEERRRIKLDRVEKIQLAKQQAAEVKQSQEGKSDNPNGKVFYRFNPKTLKSEVVTTQQDFPAPDQYKDSRPFGEILKDNKSFEKLLKARSESELKQLWHDYVQCDNDAWRKAGYPESINNDMYEKIVVRCEDMLKKAKLDDTDKEVFKYQAEYVKRWPTQGIKTEETANNSPADAAGQTYFSNMTPLYLGVMKSMAYISKLIELKPTPNTWSPEEKAMFMTSSTSVEQIYSEAKQLNAPPQFQHAHSILLKGLNKFSEAQPLARIGVDNFPLDNDKTERASQIIFEGNKLIERANAELDNAAKKLGIKMK